MTNSKLPFEFSEQSIADWLLTLSKLSSVNSANNLNKAIQRLRKTKYNPKKVLEALIQLMPTIFFISNDIETSLLSEIANPKEKASRKIEKLNIQLLRNLSLAFSVLAENESLTAEQKQQAIYIALQLIGFTQRIAAVFHEFPSSTLWEKTAELYTLAQKTSITSEEIELKIIAFKGSATIASVLKRNLLFSISVSYQFTSRQIQELFIISEQQSQLIKLNPQNPTRISFVWNLENGHPPFLCDIHSGHENTSMIIGLTAFISFIQSEDFSSEQINGQILSQLINEISGFKSIIHSTRPASFTVNSLIESYADIIEYLNKIDKLNKIQQVSSQLPSVSPPSKLFLQPMEFEKNHLDSIPEPVPSSSNFEIPKNAQTVKTLKTKYKQYVIAISNISDYSIGNLILLCKSNAESELGVIRQINFIENSNSSQLLIEKFEGKPSAHLVYSPTLTDEQVIMIHKKSSSPQIFIPLSKLSNGTSIGLANEQTLALDKLNDCSPFFMHYLTYRV